MADISRLNRFINGASRGVAISTNTIVVDNLKIKMGSGDDAKYATFSGSLTAARTISMPDANVDLAQIATNKTHVDGSGSDHADVATNSTHSGGDGSDHSDVAANTSFVADLQSVANAKGASLVSIEDSGGNFTATDVEAALAELQGNIEGKDDASEITYTPAVDADWDGDADPGNVDAALDQLAERVDDNETSISTNASGISGNDTDISNLQGALGASTEAAINYSSNYYVTDAEDPITAIGDLDAALNTVASTISNFDWQPSVIDRWDPSSALPSSPSSGDRYLSTGVGNGWLINRIYEYNGSTWDETIFILADAGTFVAVDDESDGLYLWSGVSWGKKYFEATTASTGLYKDGFDVQLADATENASGIKVLNGAITLEDLGAFDTDDLSEGSTNLYYTQARFNSAFTAKDTDALSEGSTNLYWTQARFNTAFSAKDSDDLSEGSTNLYFTDARAKSAAVSDTAYAGSWDAVTDVAPSKNAVYDKIEALDTAKQDASANLDEADTFFGATDLSGAEAETLSDGSNADSLHEHAQIIKSMIAGEAFTGTTTDTLYAVRMAVNGETDTRVYKADDDASSSDKFHVIGLAYVTSDIAAGGSIEVMMLGEITSSVAFTASADEGKAVFLGNSGAVTLTPPTAADDAIVKVGNVSKVGAAGTAKLMIQGIQVMGVN